MIMATIDDIFKEHRKAYYKANKEERGRILDRVCAVTKMARKAAIRKFKVLQKRVEGINYVDRRGRPVYYGKDVDEALRYLWEISHEVCAERLHEAIEEYIAPLARDGMWPFNDEVTGKLRAMSIGAMKSRIAAWPRVVSGGGRCMTKPSDLKEIIPVRRGPWQNPEPGVGEIDTVAHCGNTNEGSFAYTVQYTDISLTWCFLEAQMGKGKQETVQSIEAMEGRSPVVLKGLDPDTGGEFINWNLSDWCRERKIVLTRIRPGMKNDHGRIEQKNGSNVRRFVGYIRIDTEAKLAELRELLSVLEVFINHFLPSMKCTEKMRRNISHSSRKYDSPRTPYQRFMAHEGISKAHKKRMKAFHDTLNPKTLHDEILRLRKKLFKGAKFTRSDL